MLPLKYVEIGDVLYIIHIISLKNANVHSA